MASQRNTGAFIAGSVIGGLIGAAVTLWTTPKSGSELRSGFSSGGEGGVVTYRADEERVEREPRFSNPVLSFVEKAAAPIVGVELGKLAKDDPQAMTATPVRTSSADARPPASQPVGGEPVQMQRTASDSRFTPREPEVASTAASGAAYTSPARVHDPNEDVSRPSDDITNPDEAATHDSEEGSHAHAATTEDLTSPTGEYREELAEKRAAADRDPGDVDADFPDLPSKEDTSGNR